MFKHHSPFIRFAKQRFSLSVPTIAPLMDSLTCTYAARASAIQIRAVGPSRLPNSASSQLLFQRCSSRWRYDVAVDEPGVQPARKATAVSPGIVAVAIIIAIYLGLLFVGYFSFDRSSPTPKTEDLTGTSETVILLQPTTIRAVEDKLSVEMLLVPGSEFIDPEFGLLNTEMTVQLFASNGLGEFTYSERTAPGVVTISLWAWGDTNKYPFDTYTTSPVTANVTAGSDDSRRHVPARMEVAGAIHGWEISHNHMGQEGSYNRANDDAIITFSRSRVTIAMALGLCLVLLALPPSALYVAVNVARGAKKFQPPMIAWFAVMLFAVVPIREVFPENPPTGILIDEFGVLWVLISLVIAMVIFIVAWARHSD